MMRRPVALLALCASVVLSTQALAAELPQRWVSAGGALSEWISALGGEARLVGVDTTSQHPQSLKSLPSVGYQRQLSAEGILSLRPDVLVGTEEMGPPPVLAQIRKAGVRVELFSSKAEVAAVDENLKHLGQLLGAEEQAAVLASGYHQQLDALQARVRQAQAGQKAPGVLLLVGHAGAKPLIAGQGTAGDWLLSQAGGRNLAEHQGYKNFSSEALAALDPDVIVFSDRALADDEALKALLKENPALATSRAVREKRLVSLDPTLLVGGLGPRLPATLQLLAATFYPAAKISLSQ
ncbi:hemin ABC transporter substrate-binding protein [Pseudomonas plecoglossicida]|jgi:iron complex transport system substrate-binding protein|uniref:Hemin ABC transporter substrate-binding protein n=4 Tax=Pseudomonas TaxID=286 RepID=A0ABX4TTV0_PSEDL|nr:MULTISPECIES: ABC transporter substrate-binding protein [Pseudomonas]KPM59524.1 ABC transporter substrate-binding protein [Pseudomonas putida]MBO2924979.1 ABC transporter substrate-binding protein [Pseudomonas asiatica]MCE0754470.1 ABC transporter substrate-binding protein [Pseudomonas asiatica]MCE0943590.1 ABC transporter substrate-binding protein [Pseudomonas asiatica]MCE0957139.1 ABC transporter substrate-binding protein [Pseudomonas asiatica]